MINKASPAYIKTKSQAKKAMDDIAKNLNNIVAQLQNITEEELIEIGHEIITRSDELAPKDTRELVDSSYETKDVQGNKVTVEIGYTDPKSVYQHELYGESYKNPTTPGTQPKFLQTAANEIESEIKDRVAKRLEKEIK